MEVSNWLNCTMPTIDFYDKLLYRFYGELCYGYDTEGVDCTIIMYRWNGKYYVDEVKYE